MTADEIYIAAFAVMFAIWIGTLVYAVVRKNPLPMLIVVVVMNLINCIKVLTERLW